MYTPETQHFSSCVHTLEMLSLMYTDFQRMFLTEFLSIHQQGNTLFDIHVMEFCILVKINELCMSCGSQTFKKSKFVRILIVLQHLYQSLKHTK